MTEYKNLSDSISSLIMAVSGASPVLKVGFGNSESFSLYYLFRVHRNTGRCLI